MSRPVLLDVFCGAGGCSVGYHRAGFDVVGVDIKPQPRYPFEFLQADALDFLAHEDLSGIDAIHASPPCQRYSVATKSVVGNPDNHPDLVPPIRDLLLSIAKPWVIENVVGAPLERPLMLCGSMFGLLVRRHRLFECSYLLMSPGDCCHWIFQGDYACGRSSKSRRANERSRVVHVYGKGGSRGPRGLWSRAMGIDWMTMSEMAQSIPPAYTEFVGRQLMAVVLARREEKLPTKS